MHLFRHKRSLPTALVAAVVLVLQTSLATWASAAAPDVSLLDGWGNPLCITGMDQEGGNPANGHPGMPDCCTLGCGMSLAALAAPCDAGAAFPPFPVGSDAFQSAPAAAVIRSPDHHPGSPRAPPPTI